ncbi:MAG TPA: hypothetical protein VLJ19_09945 [Variovorax sp.]|nr:hypothetical protein [Variovorax sp.]
MVDSPAFRRLGRLTQHAYAPQALRSRVASFGRWAIACVACLALGAAAAFGYVQHGMLPTPCVAEPADDGVRLELTRTRLALEQEAAARTAVQQSADASAAEARRLSEELRFLRTQVQQRR